MINAIKIEKASICTYGQYNSCLDNPLNSTCFRHEEARCINAQKMATVKTHDTFDHSDDRKIKSSKILTR